MDQLHSLSAQVQTYSDPLKSGFPLKTSAKIQPIDQTSTILINCYPPSCMKKDLLAVVYELLDSMTSGARYHLVATSNPQSVTFPFETKAERTYIQSIVIHLLPSHSDLVYIPSLVQNHISLARNLHLRVNFQVLNLDELHSPSGCTAHQHDSLPSR